jgi:ABC-type uncharacterized transport system involved in gliding motility auxiliary subunit
MWTRFSGILGLIVFLFGFIFSFLIGNFSQPLLMLHMTCGLLLILFWFFTYGLKNLNQAGSVLKGRNVRFGTNAILYSGVVVGILGVIYYLSHSHNKRWDLTESAVYSLSTQTGAVLSKLKEPLRIVGFKGIAQIDEEEMKDRLDLYKQYNNSLISTEVIDARTKPHLLDKYEMKNGNIIYLEYGQGEKKSISRINESSEQGITNAIIKLSRGAAKKIYYVIGHEEPDIKSDQAPGLSSFAGAVADEHLTLETILLSQNSKLPDDTAALILCSPKKPLLKEEVNLLKKYVQEGGRLIMFADPRTSPDISDIAASFNIEIGDDVIIDQVQRLFAAPALGAQPVVRQYAQHAITRSMKPEDVTVFNIASSVKAKSSDDKSAVITELAKTGTSAWAEKDLAKLFDEDSPSATFDNGVDSPGPVSMAVAYEKKIPSTEPKKVDSESAEFDKTSRLVVFGDSDWILNANLAVYSNRDFVLNAINWLVGEEGGVSIGKKNMRLSDAPMTRENFMLLLGASFVIPELILILGLFIWWRRKHAYGV